MYYYILDSQKLSLQKFERLQVELQGLLAEFKISGEMGRITALRTMSDLVDIASQRGAKTLIACGTDDTFNQMLAQVRGRDFVVGFVPFDEASYLARILGLDNLQVAVKTIAARRIERMDLAAVGNTFFISYLEFGITTQQVKELGFWSGLKTLSASGHSLTIRIDDSYTITTRCLGGLVANTRSASCEGDTIANPTDGYLDLLILEELKRTEILRYKNLIAEGCLEKVPKTSVIKCRRVEFLEPRGFPLTISGRIITKFPVTVEVIQQRLKIIVGKNRTF